MKYKLVNVIAKIMHMDVNVMNANLDTGIFRIANLANVTDMLQLAMPKRENVSIVSNTPLDFIVKSARTVIMESPLWRQTSNVNHVPVQIPFLLVTLLLIHVTLIQIPMNLFVIVKTNILHQDVMFVLTIIMVTQKLSVANVSLAIAVIIGQKKTREIVILVLENASSAFLIRKVIIANIANQDGLEVPLRACVKNVYAMN